MDGRLLKAKEAAAQLNISTSYFYTLVQQGKIERHHLGPRSNRFKQSAIDTFLKSTCQPVTIKRNAVTVSNSSTSLMAKNSDLASCFLRHGIKLKQTPKNDKKNA